MKYFVLEVTTVSGSTAKAVWEHETMDAAKAQFHSGLASAYANPNLTYALYMIINSDGFCQVMDKIEKPEPEPEPEEQSNSSLFEGV